LNSTPLMGISSLPSATHSGGMPNAMGGIGNLGGPPPRLMSDVANGSMGGGGGGGGGGSGGVGVSSLMKKEPTGSMPPQGPGPIQPNLQSGTPAGMTASAQQSGEEQDYVVYPGRDATGALVDMKVSLQNSFSHDSVVCCVRYSWNGEFLATGSNRSAQIFDVQTGARVAVFAKDDGGADMDDGSGNDSYVRAVCFSPDGNWLITGAEDHVVKVWDVRNRTVKYKLCGHDTDIYSVDASANSQFIISGSGDKKAKLWSLETGKLLSTLGGEFGPTDGITSVSVSPTSQHVAAGSLDKIVRVWDVESSRLVRQFEGHRDSVYSVAFSPDGRLLLSGSLDKTLKLWDLAASSPSQQCRLSFSGHKDFVLSVAFSPNGQWLISGSKDRSVQFWDARQSTMCLMLQGHKNSVISIAHNPVTMSLATGSGDCRARIWSCM
jgi:general transcriptional corepressor TUP1